MLDLRFVRENAETVRIGIQNKNEKADVEELLQKDEERRNLIQQVEALKNKRNVVSEEIASLKKEKQDASALITEMQTVSKNIKELDEELRLIEQEVEHLLRAIPNMPHESVPIGRRADENQEIRVWGTKPEKSYRKDHLEIGKHLDILDFERGAKISGSGFALYKGKGATLERALINYMLDYHIEHHGYNEILPPFVVNEESMKGTGQIPKMAEDMYKCKDDDLYLIPTAEVPLTNIYRNEILTEQELSKKLCGYSACFRREAGSYGKETKGFLRVHQFNKVELVKFTKPEDSYNELESLVQNVEVLLQALHLHYRVILLCSGDTSFSSAKTYDLEVWSPCEERWLEVSSCSNFEDFQARRAHIRFRREQTGKPELVHTLNGSGLATSRLMVALLEQYQEEDGSITVPEVLQPYCRFDRITAP